MSLTSPLNSTPKYHNYLTSQNNCNIISYSSQHPRAVASNILSSDPKSIWLTNNKLPQQCIISLKKLNKKPPIFNIFGVYCWHQYDSNPALIQLWATNKTDKIIKDKQKQKNKERYEDKDKDDKWSLITKIRLNLLDTWQYFKFQQIQSDKIKQIKIRIMQNFGDSKTYINKIGLFYVNSTQLHNISQPQSQTQQHKLSTHPNNISSLHLNSPHTTLPIRQKTYSQYQKTSSSLNNSLPILQKQLRKANEQIAYLSQQQQQMKKTILKQQNIIIKIQDTLKIVLNGMQKINKIQLLNKQSQHIRQTNDKRSVYKSNQSKKNNNKQKNNKYHQQNSQSQQQQKYIKNNKNKNNKQIQRVDIQNFKHMIDKLQKYTYSTKSKYTQQLQPSYNKQSKSSTHKQISHSPQNYTDVIKTTSQDDLSQYSYHNNMHINYKTSHAQYNRIAQPTPHTNTNYKPNTNSNTKGDKVIMLQRLKKLIQLKQLKKSQLKKSGTKMKNSGDNKQSIYQRYEEDYNYNNDQSDTSSR